jgi:type II secretory pathway pseudopilin PulG
MIEKTKNQKPKTGTHKDMGYSLIELVVVMVVLLVVGGLIVGVVTSALRGGTKTKITNDIAQNGNYSLSVITNIISNAQKFISINSGSPVSGVLTRCDIDTASGTSGPFTGDKITVQGFDGGITVFACNSDGTISSNSASLTDVSQVKAESCSFTCFQSDIYSSPRIDIAFILSNASGETTESKGSASFNTSVSFRNNGLK